MSNLTTTRHQLLAQTSSRPETQSDSVTDAVTRKVRGLKLSTYLQPSDPQYAATELCVAPAEGQTPLVLMLDTNAEILAFPRKFPHGSGGFTSDRLISLTVKKYPETAQPRQALCE